jgi:hypothetical protein
MNKLRTQSLLFSAAFIFCCCASDYKYLKASERNDECISRIGPKPINTGWYHASVDVVGKHLSGLLLIKSLPDSSYRVVFTNEAGVTFFDFGFSNEGAFKVHHVIQQFDKRPVIETLRKDFELILGIPFHGMPVQAWTANDEVFYGVKQKKEMVYFITSKDCASLRRLELGSARKRKVTVSMGNEPYPTPEKIELKHNNFDMQIKLTRFEKE